MQLKNNEYRVLSDLWFAINENGFYRKAGLTGYKNFAELYEKAGEVLDKIRENHWEQNRKTAKYVAEQRKYNKNFARGKGVKAVKIIVED